MGRKNQSQNKSKQTSQSKAKSGKPKIFTPAYRTEYISRCQFREHLARKSWLSQGLSMDLGEDEEVDVYNDGVESGLVFRVQIKGTEQPLESFKDKKTDLLSYPVTIRQLSKWERLTVPVIFVIWNIDKRDGRWVAINQEVKRLNTTNPNWRSSKKTTITLKVPLTNVFDENGMQLLRASIIDLVLPGLIQIRGFEQKVDVVFDENNPEHQAIKFKFEDFMAHGTGNFMELNGPIVSVQNPEWFDQLLGIESPITPEKTIIISTPEADDWVCRLSIVNEDGKRLSINTTFRVETGGNVSSLWTNNDDPFPLKISLQLFNEGVRMLGARIVGWGQDIDETKQWIEWADALTHGGKLTITGNDGASVILTIEHGFLRFDIATEIRQAIENLLYIQDFTRRQFSLREKQLTSLNMRMAELIASLHKSRHLTSLPHRNVVRISAEVIRAFADHMRKMSSFPLHGTIPSIFNLLDQDIDLGTAEVQLEAISIVPPYMLEEMAVSGNDQDVEVYIWSGTLSLPEVTDADTQANS